MKIQILIAIILIVIGVIAFTYEGITYMSREKIIDFGPLEVTAQERDYFLTASFGWHFAGRGYYPTSFQYP